MLFGLLFDFVHCCMNTVSLIFALQPKQKYLKKNLNTAVTARFVLFDLVKHTLYSYDNIEAQRWMERGHFEVWSICSAHQPCQDSYIRSFFPSAHGNTHLFIWLVFPASHSNVHIHVCSITLSNTPCHRQGLMTIMRNKQDRGCVFVCVWRNGFTLHKILCLPTF